MIDKTVRLNFGLFRNALMLSVVTAMTLSPPMSAVAQEAASVMKEARPQLKAPNANFLQQLSFADLVEEVSPAVVSIRTEATVSGKRRMGLPPEFEKMLPEEFRGQLDRGDEESRRAIGQGSGFFINNQGHIVTNDHVVDGADSIIVVTNDGIELEATLVGTDPSTDLAVLKVTPTGSQRFVRFSPDTDLRVGDYVLAVGNPFGLGGSVTSGIVSGLDREDRTRRTQYADFIQIDASINRGNSGGPTFDLKGNVVGVNTAIISPTGVNVGIGLAVPADVAADVVAQLISDGAVTRGWLGVTIGDLDDRLAEAVGLDDTKGALVQSVQKSSPAERAGFRDGDVILKFDRKPIDSAASLTRAVGALSPGKTIKATVFRDNADRVLSVTLAKRDPRAPREAGVAAEVDAVQVPDEMEMDFGVTFSSLSDAWRRQLGLEENVKGAVVAAVERNSEAADAGIRKGMVVTKADNKTVSKPSDIEKAVKAAKARGKEVVLIRVQTQRQGAFFLALPIATTEKG